MDDYEPKYEEFSFSSMVNDLLFIFNHSHPFEKERAGKNLRYWKKLAAEEAEQERKEKQQIPSSTELTSRNAPGHEGRTEEAWAWQ